MVSQNRGLWPTQQKYDTAELMLKAAGWQFIHKEEEFWYKPPDGDFFHRDGSHRLTIARCWRAQFGTNLDKVNFDE